MTITRVVVLLLACLAGCANFKAVEQFGAATTELAQTIRAERDFTVARCQKLTNLWRAVSGDQAAANLLQGCEAYAASEARFAAVTTDVLDEYGRTLTSLSNEDAFAVSGDIEGVSGKLSALKTRQGESLVSEVTVTAITKIAELIAQTALQTKRSSAVKALAAKEEDLEKLGIALRSFFTKTPGGALRGEIAPYRTQIDLYRDIQQGDLTSSLEARMDNEPIRVRELLLEVDTLNIDLEARREEGIPKHITEAIDAWIVAGKQFSKEGTRPQPKVLFEQVKALRARTREVVLAVKLARQSWEGQ